MTARRNRRGRRHDTADRDGDHPGREQRRDRHHAGRRSRLRGGRPRLRHRHRDQHARASSFAAETAPVPGVANTASSVAISPDGTRAYVGVVTFGTGTGGFGAGGSIVLVDTASESVAGAIDSWLAAGLDCPDAGWQPALRRHPVDVRQHRLRHGVLSGQSCRRRRHDHGCGVAAIIDLGARWPQLDATEHRRRNRRDAGSTRRVHRRSAARQGCRCRREHERGDEPSFPSRPGPAPRRRPRRHGRTWCLT